MKAVYVGIIPYNRGKARTKIGESNQKSITNRMAVLRQVEGGKFKLVKYLVLKDNCESVTKVIEGYVRWQLEKIGYENVGNDHFEWESPASERQADYKEFIDYFLKFAVRGCEIFGIDYEICDPDPTWKTKLDAK
jgi:hypothetical protein